MCDRCNGTGEVVAVEHMGSRQMMPCPYCELGEMIEELETLSRQEEDIMLEIDEIDEELFFI